MKLSPHALVLCLLACLAAAFGLQLIDQQRLQHGAQQRLQSDLQGYSARLQAHLDSITAQCQRLATGLTRAPSADPGVLTPQVQQLLAQEPLVRNVVITREFKAFYVYPFSGNNSVLGLNYKLRPEFLASVTRASQSGTTVIDVPARLIQTGRDGLIVRHAVYENTGDTPAARQFWGLVNCTVDLQTLLQASGLPVSSDTLRLGIQSQRPGQPARAVWGDLQTGGGQAVAQAVHARVQLSDSHWNIGLAPVQAAPYPLHRLAVLLLLCLGTGLLFLGWWQWRTPAPTPWMSTQGDSVWQTEWARPGLRTVLLLAVLLPVPLLVGISALISFQASMGAAQVLEQRQASEMAHSLRDKTQMFFDVPRQLVTYNVEQFRTGQLRVDAPEQAVHNFLLQLRHQEWLTFLSLGTRAGDYYAASRPPKATDKALRVLQVSTGTGHAMRIQSVNDDYQGVGEVVAGNPAFQAKVRSWYQGALQRDTLHWYPTYRYSINDPQGWYDDLGLGMSAPLYDAQQRFLGVLAADVALSQLSTFLRTQMQPLDGLAFLTENGDELLASSGSGPLFRLQGEQVQRLHAAHSEHPLIRAGQAVVQAHNVHEGQQRITFEGHDYWLHWDHIKLPDGPDLTLVVLLPQSHFDGPVRQTVYQVVLLTLAFGFVGMVLTLWMAQRLVQPLLTLHGWALQLAQGLWPAPPDLPGPVREVGELAQALGTMAERLQQHTIELEQRVAERTSALQMANEQLQALAHTDGLTGIANRRHFDAALEKECARAQRSGQSLALLMCDVDHFKAYNDHYGHQMGDEVLRTLAQLMQAQARRAGDLAARYGGEEFAFIAPHLDEVQALELAQTLCTSLAQRALEHAASAHRIVSVSVGVVVWHPGQGLPTAQALVHCADRALYQAKEQGRNRVHLGTYALAA